MTLRFKKCLFLLLETIHLGYVISSKGIKMDPEKVRVIEHFPEPKCAKDLQSFLGFINVYKKFSAKHSELVEPLLKLLKKDSVWKWGVEEKAAFNSVKRNFIDTVVLKYPDFSKPFYLGTDSSVVSAAGELYQFDDDGFRRPICFHSRVLTKCERNYTTTELELLALVSCCKEFRQYILGFPLTVRTDHNALTFLNT